MPDGEVLSALRRLRKDNTGYALRHLLVGAEGTLGFITAAVLKLVPRPAATEVALCAVRVAQPPPPSCSAASSCTTRPRCRRSNTCPAPAWASCCAHIPGAILPLAEPGAALRARRTRHHPARRAHCAKALEAVLEAALEAGLVQDAAIAESEAQRQAIWRLREEHAEAQKREGASVKNDVSVPISRVPELIARATAGLRGADPRYPRRAVRPSRRRQHPLQPRAARRLVRPTPSSPAAHDIMHAVNDIVRELGGSFSAEHGVGRLKPDMMAEWRGGVELETMRRIKAALDPLGLMNPGKLLPG